MGMKDKVKILFIGDIIAEPGFNLVKDVISNYISDHGIDFVIANGENITGGMGIVERDANKLMELPINVLTGGNHTLDKIQSHKFINDSKNILRPLNYPRGVYGNGYGIYEVDGTGIKISVINLLGRIYMKPIECPFRTFDRVYEKIKEITNIIIVDFHAEATSEKIAFGWHSDGRASAVIGTHTHVQTADNRIMPEGTAYITDVGMTGPYDSVIGMKKEGSVKRYLFGTPHKHEVAEGDVKFAAVIIEINTETGRALSIERILEPGFEV